jgi:hypothetical protein
MRRQQQREQAKICQPRPQRPVRCEERILARQRLQPDVIHARHRRAQWPGCQRPCAYRDHGDEHGAPETTHQRIEPRERNADEYRKPDRGGDVHGGRDRDENDSRPETAPQQRGDGQGAEAEREHPRMKIGLEGVGAGARNVVPQGEGGGERGRHPGRAIDALADQNQRRPNHENREHVAGEEQPVERQACASSSAASRGNAAGLSERRLAGM